MMTEALYAKNTLLIGGDPGNTSTKISFLDKDGNISDFSISTIIAPAPTTADNMKNNKQKDAPIEDFLHVRIRTESLERDDRDATWFVGEYAKNKKGSIQPKITDKGSSEKKFEGDNKALFTVPLLTSYAVAAVKAGKDKVNVPLFFGIPVEQYKAQGNKLLEQFIGVHEVTFIDGPFKGHRVEIVIEDGDILVESVTTAYALEYTIENGKLLATEIGKALGDRFAIADLGAGTTDIAVFTPNGVEKSQTHNTEIGTNKYIDKMIKEISSLDEYKDILEARRDKGMSGKELLAYQSREKFVFEVIKPAIDQALTDNVINLEEIKFTSEWIFKETEETTRIVHKYMQEYALEQMNSLIVTRSELKVDDFMLVGGGVLFGYFGGIMDKHAKFRMSIPSLKASQFFNSRAYLINNYSVQYEKERVNA